MLAFQSSNFITNLSIGYYKISSWHNKHTDTDLGESWTPVSKYHYHVDIKIVDPRQVTLVWYSGEIEKSRFDNYKKQKYTYHCCFIITLYFQKMLSWIWKESVVNNLSAIIIKFIMPVQKRSQREQRRQMFGTCVRDGVGTYSKFVTFRHHYHGNMNPWLGRLKTAMNNSRWIMGYNYSL